MTPAAAFEALQDMFEIHDNLKIRILQIWQVQKYKKERLQIENQVNKTYVLHKVFIRCPIGIAIQFKALASLKLKGNTINYGAVTSQLFI